MKRALKDLAILAAAAVAGVLLGFAAQGADRPAKGAGICFTDHEALVWSMQRNGIVRVFRGRLLSGVGIDILVAGDGSFTVWLDDAGFGCQVEAGTDADTAPPPAKLPPRYVAPPTQGGTP